MGHLHPTYSRRGSPLSGRPVWLLLRGQRLGLFEASQQGEIEIYVVPSFNRELSYAGFTSSKGRIISPVIRRILKGVQEVAILTLDGEIIGGTDSLPYVL